MHEEKMFRNGRGQLLNAHYWYPEDSSETCAMIFLSHGFSEHLGMYKEIAEHCNSDNILVFGHDHAGHGRSEGKRAYIESVDEYCEDVIQHTEKMKAQYPHLKCFLLGHSMGGMVAVRTVLLTSGLFDGLILNGPLIVPGPQLFGFDLRPSPLKTLISRTFLTGLSMICPELQLGRPDLSQITRDKAMHEKLTEDPLRWTGGCKVMLLLAFVNCLEENFNLMSDISLPLFIVHGEDDVLCNKVGSSILHRDCKSGDKDIVIYPEAKHQIFFEYSEIRDDAFSKISNFVKRRA